MSRGPGRPRRHGQWPTLHGFSALDAVTHAGSRRETLGCDWLGRVR
jgi:hypothetical protein